MGLLLSILASVFSWLLRPVNIVFALIKCRDMQAYFFKVAIAKDQLGNVRAKYFFDTILINENGYSFGNEDETISSVIGKNKLKGTLTRTGKFLDYILESLDKNHSVKSIEADETNIV